MSVHEQKYCPRCNTLFECKVGSILLCQCVAVKVNDDERDYFKQLYGDCLCAKCLTEVKSEFANKKLLEKIDRLMRK